MTHILHPPFVSAHDRVYATIVGSRNGHPTTIAIICNPQERSTPHWTTRQETALRRWAEHQTQLYEHLGYHTCRLIEETHDRPTDPFLLDPRPASAANAQRPERPLE